MNHPTHLVVAGRQYRLPRSISLEEAREIVEIADVNFTAVGAAKRNESRANKDGVATPRSAMA